MDRFNDLPTRTAKELRKLRMNLNNRIESFKKDDNAKELAKSHMLHGLNHKECVELLLKIKQVEKNLK
ncbi:MAG: hypothetical protein HQK51_12670 [Oligoflexia bacterium]|nr:hypothetical protein [Oligoflexia bacterium]